MQSEHMAQEWRFSADGIISTIAFMLAQAPVWTGVWAISFRVFPSIPRSLHFYKEETKAYANYNHCSGV